MGLPYEEGQSIKRCEVLSELLLSVSVHIASIQCSAEILLKFSFGKGVMENLLVIKLYHVL